MTEGLRLPPSSADSERAVLGALLLRSDAYDRISFLEARHFYRDDHRRIYGVLLELIEKGVSPDLVLVCDRLKAKAELDKAGGMSYIAELAQGAPSAANIARYAAVVRDKAILRELAQKGTEIAERALTGLDEPVALAEEAGAAFMSIKLDSGPAEMAHIGAALTEAVEFEDNPVKGLSSGFRVLDQRYNGLQPGDFIVLAGRPSMGKTSLAMNIAEYVARETTVAVFSLEMTRAKLARRMLRYHQTQMGRDAAVDHISGAKLWIDHSAVVTAGHMRLRLRRLQRTQGLGLVVIDYLTLMSAKGENRTQEVSTISRECKAIAKEFMVPLIAVAQLSRSVEARTDHRPQLSDLRESGQIEQDADIITFLYREELYKPDTEWRGIAEAITRKNRDGATGTDYLTFMSEHSRFVALDRPLPERALPKVRATNFTDFKSKAAGD